MRGTGWWWGWLRHLHGGSPSVAAVIGRRSRTFHSHPPYIRKASCSDESSCVRLSDLAA